jgi:hypothetical protein
MVNMSGRDVDELKKVGYKQEIVSCCFKKLMILNNLVRIYINKTV